MKIQRTVALLTIMAAGLTGCAVPLDPAFRPTLAFATNASSGTDRPPAPTATLATSPIRSMAPSTDPPPRAESDATPGAWITMAIVGAVMAGGGAAMIDVGTNTNKGADCNAASNPCAGRVVLYTLGAVSALVGAIFLPLGVVAFIGDASSERHHEVPDTGGRFY